MGWFSLPSPATKLEVSLFGCRQLEHGETDGVGNYHTREGHSPFPAEIFPLGCVCPDSTLNRSILQAQGGQAGKWVPPSHPPHGAEPS